MTRNGPLPPPELSVLGRRADHRVLTVPQVAVLLGISDRTAKRQLGQLREAGLLRMGRIFDGLPAAVSITRAGLRAIDSPLKALPQVNLNQYRHEVGVGWLWLAARSGRFGELTGLTAEREMRAADAGASAAGRVPQWGVGLGLLGRHGRPQRHYPDLILDTAGGHRVAVELELSSKGTQRMRQIMTAYASDAQIDHVLYLVSSPSIAKLVSGAAHRAGMAGRVHVQLLEPDGIAGAGIGVLQDARRDRARAGQRQGPRTADLREAQR